MHKELSFIIPAVLDKNFAKCQVFCVSKILSDLVGRCIFYQNFSFQQLNSAAWVSKELKRFESSVKVAKLNEDNSFLERKGSSNCSKKGKDQTRIVS